MDLSSCRTVEDVARLIVRSNKPRYGRKLIELLPDMVRPADLDDSGNVKASERLNELRFEKEAVLCKMLGIAYPPEKAYDQVTYKRCLDSFGHGRRPVVGKLCVEIKFLFNVASALNHW
jgi:hypothetical protein